MGLNVKLGKGGHGLEVYDEEGKYASEFSFDLGGQKIKGYDDFRSLYFANLAQNSAGQYNVDFLNNLYETNQGFKDNVDAQLYPGYNDALTNAVNEYNQKTQVWNTPEEAADHIEELFVPSLVQNLIDNGILNSDRSSVARGYKVDTFAACLQMSRYPKRRANIITKEDYENRANNKELQIGRLSSNSSIDEIENYINDALANERYVPITRAIYCEDNDELNVLESFYDENSPRHSCLSNNGDGYLGSIIYCSTGGYDGYTRMWGAGTVVQGMVKLNNKLKLLECPVTQDWGSQPRCNSSIIELKKFRNQINNDLAGFEKRMTDKILASGATTDPADAKIITQKFYNKLTKDPGFCAMLMGYDAIWGLSFQFDILNLGILDVVKKE